METLQVYNYFTKEKVLEKYPTIKTTTSKVYDYALGGNKDIPSKHLCLPIWYGLEKNVVDKVINELKIKNFRFLFVYFKNSNKSLLWYFNFSKIV